MSLDIETHIFQIFQNIIFLEEFYHDKKLSELCRELTYTPSLVFPIINIIYWYGTFVKINETILI